MMKYLFAICCLVLASACTPPTTKTSTVNDEPTLTFVNAPKDAEIYLNGLYVGKADDFNGNPKSLIVPRGTHLVEVKDNNRVLLSEKAFVSDGATKSFNLKGLK